MKIAYWIATGLTFALMALAIVMYPLNYAAVVQTFEGYNYPGYVVLPLAALKLAALLIILTNRYRNLKDIAYGAYFLNMVMATVAHLQAGDVPVHAFVGLVAIPISYALSNRVRGEPKRDAFLF